MSNEEGFEKFGIQQDLIDKLKTRYIKQPTKIQELVIPKILEGKNVLFRSATGTGKTFAYLLPVFSSRRGAEAQRTQRGIKILISAPTLELCSQIESEINFLLESSSTAHCSLFTVHCIIGTPGRLLSLAKTGKLKLKGLRFLILDEADRLTAKDCLEDAKELLLIIKKHSKDLQVIGCSATVNKKNCEKLDGIFKDAEIIECEDNDILKDKLQHWAIYSEKRKKADTLRSFIAAINNSTGKSKKSKIKILVFTSKNDDAALIHSKLLHHKVNAAALYSKVEKKPISAEQRKTALNSFKKGDTQVLVATDLAARGLDILGVSHVVALDVPEESDVYIHRAGRTARAGKRGIMATIGDETQMRLLASLEKKLKICITPKELYGGRILEIDNN